MSLSRLLPCGNITRTSMPTSYRWYYLIAAVVLALPAIPIAIREASAERPVCTARTLPSTKHTPAHFMHGGAAQLTCMRKTR